ncbi:hypothetical protein NX059_005407 [Plenodomus lindquistii]|nr:hypothetical protein NX059_005407 [Plenodomus lindquistii]
MDSDELTSSDGERLPDTTTTFRAAHLDIPIDPRNQPPETSSSFKFLRIQTKIAWDALEAAGRELLTVESQVEADMSVYVRERRTTYDEYESHRNSLILQTFPGVIDIAESCSRDMAVLIGKLKDAVSKEPTTLEARAATAIDIPIIKNCSKAILDIIDITKFQLAQAKRQSDLER